VGRTSYIYRPFRPIALGLYRPIATGFISLNHRLRKPEVIGFVSLIDHYDVQFKVVGIGPLTPPTPTKVAPTLSNEGERHGNIRLGLTTGSPWRNKSYNHRDFGGNGMIVHIE
jgi:hypothetical protein